MLTQLYIEALLVDERRADEVWQSWAAGEMDDATAAKTWGCIAAECDTPAKDHLPVNHAELRDALRETISEKLRQAQGQT